MSYVKLQSEETTVRPHKQTIAQDIFGIKRRDINLIIIRQCKLLALFLVDYLYA